jgi:hypothetical protein
MNFGRYTIWYNHEDHVWDIYDGNKGYKYPEYTINNYSGLMNKLRDRFGFLDTDRNHRRFWRVMRWWDRLRHGRR